MAESKYYCRNCGAEIKPTDEVCPKCRKKLREVGKRIEVTIPVTIGVSASVKTELTKKQRNIIQKVVKTLKDEFAKKEIESITFGFPQLISVKIKNKKEKEGKT
jgi:hypothetical protein